MLEFKSGILNLKFFFLLLLLSIIFIQNTFLNYGYLFKSELLKELLTSIVLWELSFSGTLDYLVG